LAPSFWSILKARIILGTERVGAALKPLRARRSRRSVAGKNHRAAGSNVGDGHRAGCARRVGPKTEQGLVGGCLVGLRLGYIVQHGGANAGVGMVTENTLGRTKRRPSVSTKKNVLSLRMDRRSAPPTDWHWRTVWDRRNSCEPVVGVHHAAVPPVRGVAVELIGSGHSHITDLRAGQLAVLPAVSVGDDGGFLQFILPDGEVRCARIVDIEIRVHIVLAIDGERLDVAGRR